MATRFKETHIFRITREFGKPSRTLNAIVKITDGYLEELEFTKVAEEGRFTIYGSTAIWEFLGLTREVENLINEKS